MPAIRLEAPIDIGGDIIHTDVEYCDNTVEVAFSLTDDTVFGIVEMTVERDNITATLYPDGDPKRRSTHTLTTYQRREENHDEAR